MGNEKRIADLVRQRKPLLQATDRAEHAFRDLRQKLSDLDAVRSEVAGQVSSVVARPKLEELSFADLIRRSDDLLSVLGRARRRFERPQIQIGVLGRAGQGKSTLLQHLTGLGPDVIPSGGRGHCTGALCTITHQVDAAPPCARLTFHGEAEFLRDLILSYYDYFEKNNPGLLGPRPDSLAQFARADLHTPALDELYKAGTDAAAKLRHLRDYQSHLGEYRPLLDQPPRLVARGEICDYVAQERMADGGGTITLHKFRAVRSAEILCRFPHGDVAGLRFADMPGLGDTGIIQGEELIRTLAEDTDLVLLVRYPVETRTVWFDVDTALYTTAAKALGSLLPVHSWMWVILNRDGSNDGRCEALLATMPEHGIQVAEAVVADCHDPEEVRALVLDPVLTFLERKLSELDHRYLANVHREVDAFLLEVTARCEAAKRALPKLPSGDESQRRVWKEKHRAFELALKKGVEGLVRKMREVNHHPDVLLRDAIQKVLSPASAEPGIPPLIPTQEELNDLHALLGNWMATQGVTMERVRSRLTHRFLQLDASLEKTFAEAKREVLGALQSAGIVLDESELGADPFAGLESMAMEADCPELAESFRFLKGFRLTYFGFIHHRIREHLDPLTPDTQAMTAPESAKQAVEFLRNAVAHSLYLVGKSLELLVTEPSMARYAMVEEFKDLTLRREEVEKQWEDFTDHFREKLWPNDFRRLAGEHGMYRSWLDAVRAVQVAATATDLRLIAASC